MKKILQRDPKHLNILFAYAMLALQNAYEPAIIKQRFDVVFTSDA